MNDPLEHVSFFQYLMTAGSQISGGTRQYHILSDDVHLLKVW